jgi:hypothetical protein
MSKKLAAISEPFVADPFPYDLIEITPEQLTLDEARSAATLLRSENHHAINLTHDGVPETERAQYANYLSISEDPEWPNGKDGDF